MQLIQKEKKQQRENTYGLAVAYYNYLIKTETYTTMRLTLSENLKKKRNEAEEHRRQVLDHQNHLLNRGGDPNHLPQNLLYNPNHQRNLNQGNRSNLVFSSEEDMIAYAKRESLKLNEILQEDHLSEAIYNSLQSQKKPRNSNQDDSMITNPIAKESKNLSQDVDKKKVEQVKNDREDIAQASQKDKKAVVSSSEDGGNSDGKSSQSLVITTLATLSLIAGGIGLMYLITQKNKKNLSKRPLLQASQVSKALLC